MFFHHQKKNTLLYEGSENSVRALQTSRVGIRLPFPKIFSAWRWGGALFFILLAGGTLAYGLFFSTEFRITAIRVQGASPSDAAAIYSFMQSVMQQKVLYILPKNSYFLFPEAETLSSLQAQFPKLSSIALSHPDPNNIVISVTERSITGIWCPFAGSGQVSAVPQSDSLQTNAAQGLALSGTGGPCAFFDEDGVIFEQAPDATFGHLLFVVRDARDPSLPALGTHVLEKTTYEFLQNLRSALVNAGRVPVSFTIKNAQEVDANFLDGTHAWDVYFSTLYGAQYQTDVLSRLLSEKVGAKNFPYLDYVDLRLENKAYYSIHPAG